MFTPKLEILPHAQRRLWDELRQTPEEFVLYRGTALALRLGHRHSEDFDFFSNNTFARTFCASGFHTCKTPKSASLRPTP